MPARKRTPARKTKAPGQNIGEWQRRTQAVKLRLAADVAAKLRARAAEDDVSMSDYVTRLVETDNLVIE